MITRSRPPGIPLGENELDVANTLINEANALLRLHGEDPDNDGTGDDLPVLTEVIFDLGESAAPPAPAPETPVAQPTRPVAPPPRAGLTPQPSPPRVPPAATPPPRVTPQTAPPPRVTPQTAPPPRVTPQTAPPPRVTPQTAPPPRVTPQTAPPPRVTPQTAPPPRVTPVTAVPPRSAAPPPQAGLTTLIPSATIVRSIVSPPPIALQTGLAARILASQTQATTPAIRPPAPQPRPSSLQPPQTAASAPQPAEPVITQTRVQAIAEDLRQLDTFIVGAVETWMREELPSLLMREIAKLNERLRTEALVHLRTTLLPRLSEHITEQVDKLLYGKPDNE
ncbi:MAG: hypothetical protein LBT71_03170 [Azoarcus sp.]|jgi:hypothetical protein|nr:hypothetical protein [Azoarcus sp.]